MNITINGQSKQINDQPNLSSIIKQFCKDSSPIIAEVNGNIVKKPSWEQLNIQDGDTIELVNFVGGG